MFSHLYRKHIFGKITEEAGGGERGIQSIIQYRQKIVACFTVVWFIKTRYDIAIARYNKAKVGNIKKTNKISKTFTKY